MREGVGEDVVVREGSRSDVEGNYDVYRVVLVSSEDEEGSEEVQGPADRLDELQLRG